LRREGRRAKETRDMIEALRKAQPAVPQTVFIEHTKLPKMSKGEYRDIPRPVQGCHDR